MLPLPARDTTRGEPHSFASLDGSVYLHIDLERSDCYIQTKRYYTGQSLCDAITQAEWWGLELIDEDESEPELTDDGGTRIYLKPIIPASQVAPLSLRTVMSSLPSQRGAAQFAGAA